MNVIESNPQPPPENKTEELKQRFQKRQEEKEKDKEMDLEALSDEQLVNTIKNATALWEKRRTQQLKEMEERHSRLNALIGATAPSSVKRRGRKPKGNAGD